MPQMRRSRQRETAIVSTNSVSASVAGLNSLVRDLSIVLKPSRDSPSRTTVRARRPWRRLFRADACFPLGETWPRERAPLEREASIWRRELMIDSYFHCAGGVGNFRVGRGVEVVWIVGVRNIFEWHEPSLRPR